MDAAEQRHGIQYATSKPDYSVWHAHKGTIEGLYLGEGKSLNVVKDIMEAIPGFPKTSRSMFHQILRKELRLGKNVTKSERLQISQGKMNPAEMKLDAEKVARSMHRHKKQMRRDEDSRGLSSRPLAARNLTLQGPASSTALAARQIPQREASSVILEKVLGSVTSHYMASALTSCHLVALQNRAHAQAQGRRWSYKELWDRLPFQVFAKNLQDQAQIWDMLNESLYWLASLYRRQDAITDTSLSLIYSGTLHPPSAGMNGSLSLDVLKKACFDMLSNPNDLHDESLLLLDWIGHIADNSLLSLFFSSALAVAPALWESLIQRARWMRHSNAFETLVEVSASINNYQWVRSAGSRYLFTAVHMGSERALGIARRLLQLGVSPNQQIDGGMTNFEKCDCGDVHLYYCTTPLQLAAHHQDEAMMQVLIEFGAQVEGPWEKSASITPLRRVLGKPGASQFNCVKLLIEAGARTEAIFSRAGADTLMDLLRLSQWHSSNKIRDPRIYNLLAATSETTRNWVAILEVIATAQDGVDSLRNYVESQLLTFNGNHKLTLEIAMSEAVKTQQKVALSSLLAFGVDPRAPTLLHHCPSSVIGAEWNPLLRAVENLDTELLQVLIGNGAHVSSCKVLDAVTRQDVQRGSRLSQSTEHRDKRLSVLKCLLANGVDVTQKNGQSLLRAAIVPLRYSLEETDIFVPDFELYETLTAAGVDPHLNHFDDQSLLHMALARGCDLTTLKFLIGRNHTVHARPDATGHSMLQYARCRCRKNRSGLIQLLYEHAVGDPRPPQNEIDMEKFLCDFIYSDTDNEVSLWKKRLPQGTFKLLRDLFRRRSKVQIQKANTQHDLWDGLLCYLIEVGSSDGVVQQAIDAGAAIGFHGFVCGTQRCEQSTPLHSAIKCQRFDLAKRLIGQGASITSHVDGRSALQQACGLLGTPTDFLEFLISQGANVNELPSGPGCWTALQIAAECSSLNAVTVLLDHGADVNEVRAEMNTALDYAVRPGNLDIVKLLLCAGARSGTPGRTNYDGSIHIAKREGHHTIARILAENGSL